VSTAVSVQQEFNTWLRQCNWLDGWGSIPGRIKSFLSLQRPNLHWHEHNLQSSGYRGCFPGGVKRQRREADRSPSPSAEVKNCGAIPSLCDTISWVMFNYLNTKRTSPNFCLFISEEWLILCIKFLWYRPTVVLFQFFLHRASREETEESVEAHFSIRERNVDLFAYLELWAKRKWSVLR
jgi:hypothetical protein